MSPTKERFFGLDLIRFFSILAIVQFHLHESIFYTDVIEFSSAESLHALVQPYSRYLSFSGFTIVLLSSFLIGRAAISRRTVLKLLAIMWVGFFVLAAVEAEDGEWFLFEWDIYPFLLVTFTSIFLIQRFRRILTGVAFVGLCLLFLPVWHWIDMTSAPGFLRQALVGDCLVAGGGGWPVIPWVGLPYLGFYFGRLYRDSMKCRLSMSSMRLRELIFWAAALGLSLFRLGAFYPVPCGPGFGCFVYRQPAMVLWSHLVWVIFLMRVSLVGAVNLWLSRSVFVRFVSELYWSRHFGLCYLLHWVLIGGASYFVEAFKQNPRLFDVVLFSVLPGTELLARGVLAVVKFIGRRSR